MRVRQHIAYVQHCAGQELSQLVQYLNRGDHYLPQHYLSGFTAEDGALWAFPKTAEPPFATQPKSVANENALYSPTTEQYLANEIEGPATSVLDKIRLRRPITHDDTTSLARYMAAMWKRVPAARARVHAMMPSVSEDLRADFDKMFQGILAEDPGNASVVEARKREINQWLDIFKDNPPEELWQSSTPTQATPRIAPALAATTWTFLTHDDKPVFLTGDNPVFQFPHIGIGKPQSEVSFPISSRVLL